MNDQQQIRADALTEAERLLLARVNDCTKPIDAADRNGILKLIDRLAASQSSQPAAAPIDTPTDREFALSAAICVHPKGVYGDEGGSMCCPITHTRDASFAPSPADERKIVAQLLFALTERQKGNVIRSEDEYIDSARALLAAHPGQPSLKNPLTPYGMLVRALRIVSGTTLMDMAKALLTTPAKLSAMEFGRAPVTPEFAFDVAAYFDALGVPCTEYALRAAARAQGGES